MSALSWIEQTRERYVRGGLAGRLGAVRRPAIVVVDLQRGFTDPTSPCGTDLSPTISATRHLLDGAREHGLPVLFTVIAFSPQQLRELVWLRKLPAMHGLLLGGRDAELDPQLARQPEEAVVVKQAPSAFFGTDLQSRLTAAAVDGLIVCGATTSGCVRATAVDACSANWPTFVPRECVGDREPGPHEASLLDIDAKYADVIDLAGAEAMLAQAVAE